MAGNRSGNPFMRLPRELRDLIYAYYWYRRQDSSHAELYIQFAQPECPGTRSLHFIQGPKAGLARSWQDPVYCCPGHCHLNPAAYSQNLRLQNEACSRYVLPIVQVDKAMRYELLPQLLSEKVLAIAMPPSPGPGPRLFMRHFEHWLPHVKRLDLRNVDLHNGGGMSKVAEKERLLSLIRTCTKLESLSIEFLPTMTPWTLHSEPFQERIQPVWFVHRLMELKGLQAIDLRLSTRYESIIRDTHDRAWHWRWDWQHWDHMSFKTIETRKRIVRAGDNCRWLNTKIKQELGLGDTPSPTTSL